MINIPISTGLRFRPHMLVNLIFDQNLPNIYLNLNQKPAKAGRLTHITRVVFSSDDK